MAFVAEDGNGIPNANSLASVEFADEYHAERANDAWADFDEGKKQAGLIRATDYICRRYAMRWASVPVSLDQGLPFPRLAFVGIPPRYVREAVADVALYAAEKPLLRSPDAPTTGSLVERTVGPITRKFAPLSSADLRSGPDFGWLDDVLELFLTDAFAGGLNFAVSRA